MKERTVVVYGADTPLGESLCRCLDMQSANVFMVGKDKQKLRELQNDMYYESYVYGRNIGKTRRNYERNFRG